MLTLGGVLTRTRCAHALLLLLTPHYLIVFIIHHPSILPSIHRPRVVTTGKTADHTHGLSIVTHKNCTTRQTHSHTRNPSLARRPSHADTPAGPARGRAGDVRCTVVRYMTCRWRATARRLVMSRFLARCYSTFQIIITARGGVFESASNDIYFRGLLFFLLVFFFVFIFFAMGYKGGLFFFSMGTTDDHHG